MGVWNHQCGYASMHESENKNDKINNGEISDVNTMSSNHIINKTSMKLLLIINI